MTMNQVRSEISRLTHATNSDVRFVAWRKDVMAAKYTFSRLSRINSATGRVHVYADVDCNDIHIIPVDAVERVH
jgi:hypothetical protein